MFLLMSPNNLPACRIAALPGMGDAKECGARFAAAPPGVVTS